jgi:hypothetical protein
MTHPVQQLRFLLATKLGACAKCIRLSLRLSIAAWAAFGAVTLLIPGSAVTGLVLWPALALSVLLSAHLVAYSVRVMLAWKAAGQSAHPSSEEIAKERRVLLSGSLRTVALIFVPAVVASAMLPRGILGAVSPDCAGHGTGLCACKGCHTTIPQNCPYYAICAQTCNFLGGSKCVTLP